MIGVGNIEFTSQMFITRTVFFHLVLTFDFWEFTVTPLTEVINELALITKLAPQSTEQIKPFEFTLLN